jgi:hypothetical protein
MALDAKRLYELRDLVTTLRGAAVGPTAPGATKEPLAETAEMIADTALMLIDEVARLQHIVNADAIGVYLRWVREHLDPEKKDAAARLALLHALETRDF